MVQASDVQKLREMTGIGVMDCKKALEEACGDFEKAVGVIRERGMAKAEKKKERVANAGCIESYIHNDRVGVLLELYCETDFVAKGTLFKELAHNLAMQIAAMSPETVDDLLGQEYIKNTKFKIEEIVNEVIAQIGENIKVGRFVRFEI
ncbi:MAG: translation elongation factor Ts [bacterium]